MSYKLAVTFAILVATSSHAAAAENSDPVFGNDQAANAVLTCHADYAKSYASKVPSASATEIAQGARARCAEQMQAFSRNALSAAKASKSPDDAVFASKRQEEQTAKLEDYAYSYTIDAYLKAKALF